MVVAVFMPLAGFYPVAVTDHVCPGECFDPVIGFISWVGRFRPYKYSNQKLQNIYFTRVGQLSKWLGHMTIVELVFEIYA